MHFAAIIIFCIGLYAFITGVFAGSLADLMGGTICLLLSHIIYPNK